MDITLASLNEIFVGLDLRYQKAYEYAQPWHQEIATTGPSNSRETKYGWIGKILRPRKWVGERTLLNLAAREYGIINDDFELTIEIERNDIMDDQLSMYSQGIDLIGEQMKLHPDDLCYFLMVNGDSATQVATDIGTLVNPIGFDNLSYFNGSHPIDMNNVALGTQSNLFNSTTSGALPLNNNNWAFVRAQMLNYRGEDNRPMGIVPDRLVVPPQLELTAYQSASATLIAQAVGANAAQAQENVVPLLSGAVKPLMVPQLAGDAVGGQDTWYPMATKKAVRPLTYQLRKAPEFIPLDKPSDANVFFRKKYIYGADCRDQAGYSLWFLAAKCANH